MQVQHSALWTMSVIATRSAIVLIWLILLLRLGGKRSLGQTNIYDLAMVMAIANAVQNAMTHGQGEFVVGIASAGILLVVGKVLATLFVRLPRLEDRIAGHPTVIITDGQIDRDHMRREHITEGQVQVALRQHGLISPSQVRLAVLELDGSLSIVPRKEPQGQDDQDDDDDDQTAGGQNDVSDPAAR